MTSNQGNRIPLPTDGACNGNLRAYYQRLERSKRYLVVVELRDASKAPANSPVSRSVKVSSMNAVYVAVTDLALEYHLEEVAEREAKKAEVVPAEITDGSLDGKTCAVYRIESYVYPERHGIAYQDLQSGKYIEAWIDCETEGTYQISLDHGDLDYRAVLICTIPMAQFKAYKWRLDLIHRESETLPQTGDYEGISMDILIPIALAEIDLERVGKGVAEDFTYPVVSRYKLAAKKHFGESQQCE
ncbi:MAG TPA: hypothetical protein V6C65_42220 [Allocoleopsis sp.]